MRFLADENFPWDAVKALRAAGHDVACIRTDAPGIADDDVLAQAVNESRILITFDKDFGELAWHAGWPASCGIVLFRFLPPPSRVGQVMVEILESRRDWQAHFSVIEAGRIRMRPLISGA